MTRSELEHTIRAAGAIVGDGNRVVISSLAILGQFPSAPGVTLHHTSNEPRLGRKELLESPHRFSVG